MIPTRLKNEVFEHIKTTIEKDILTEDDLNRIDAIILTRMEENIEETDS